MTDDSKTARRWPAWLLIIGFFTIIGLLSFGYKYFDDLARERAGTFLPRFAEEMTGAYAAALLFPFILKFARRFRLGKRNWVGRLPAHLVAMIVFSVAHTTMNALFRHAISQAVGAGPYDYGVMTVRYLMEFFNDAVNYCTIVAFIYLFDHYRLARDREVQTAQLEARLAEAQLESLRLQIQPHFLFNALNTVSSLVYENPRAADEMIARLSDLLRLSLRNSDAQEVTLREEIKFLNLYLDVMRARFEERLQVSIEAGPETSDALVPQLVLQPLVENSIRHGVDPDSGMVKIIVRASRDNGSLLLQVSDCGPGIAQKDVAAAGGIGLSNTTRRLDQLYGAAHEFKMAGAATGGLLVEVRLPFHTSTGGKVVEGASPDGNDPRFDS
jgi:two-component system, LytTR family, sensor kinase